MPSKKNIKRQFLSYNVRSVIYPYLNLADLSIMSLLSKKDIKQISINPEISENTFLTLKLKGSKICALQNSKD